MFVGWGVFDDIMDVVVFIFEFIVMGNVVLLLL